MKTNYADTLNALCEMQDSLIYRARRGVLAAAESIIVNLESLLQKSIASNDDWQYRALAAEKALAEVMAGLERLRDQEPVVVISSPEWDAIQKGEDACCSKFDREMDCSGTMPVLLYAEPKPPAHPGATHCDNCGCTWLDDGLNPIGCPYCKPIDCR